MASPLFWQHWKISLSSSPANAFHKSHHNFIYLLFYFILLTLVSLLEGLCFSENNPGREAKRHSSYSEVNPADFLPALFYGALRWSHWVVGQNSRKGKWGPAPGLTQSQNASFWLSHELTHFPRVMYSTFHWTPPLNLGGISHIISKVHLNDLGFWFWGQQTSLGATSGISVW